MPQDNENCPICTTSCDPHDAVDFNKSCEELRGTYLPKAGIPVAYYRCTNCGFCFAPAIARWSLAEFEERIYNKDYVAVDPDYVDARPRANAEGLRRIFGERGPHITHLDYGGGNGLLSTLLNQQGWQSRSYDPFADRDVPIERLGKFDLITAYEVFEHVPDPRSLLKELSALVNADGIILFSTLLSDGELAPDRPLTWWYASPRNGHISLFSRNSLALLARDYGLRLGSFSSGFHCMWRKVPSWATHLFSAS